MLNAYGKEMPEIKVGTYVRPELWPIGNKLNPGLEGFCPFYLPTNSGGPIKEVAVRVEYTGRTPRRLQGDYYYRVKITFVGDGEPDTETGGWVPAFPAL